MPKRIIKIISLLLTISLSWTGFSSVFYTVAYFNDTEESLSNTLSAGTLDFYLEAMSDFSPKASFGIPASREILIINNGTSEFNYNIKANNFSGNLYLCENLNLEASLNSNIEYSGPLESFDYSAGTFDDPAEWNFTATIATNDAVFNTGLICNFDLIFDGQQIGGDGFSDQEIISNTVVDGEEILPIIEEQPIVYSVPNTILEIGYALLENNEEKLPQPEIIIETENIVENIVENNEESEEAMATGDAVIDVDQSSELVIIEEVIENEIKEVIQEPVQESIEEPIEEPVQELAPIE